MRVLIGRRTDFRQRILETKRNPRWQGRSGRTSEGREQFVGPDDQNDAPTVLKGGRLGPVPWSPLDHTADQKAAVSINEIAVHLKVLQANVIGRTGVREQAGLEELKERPACSAVRTMR